MQIPKYILKGDYSLKLKCSHLQGEVGKLTKCKSLKTIRKLFLLWKL